MNYNWSYHITAVFQLWQEMHVNWMSTTKQNMVVFLFPDHKIYLDAWSKYWMPRIRFFLEICHVCYFVISGVPYIFKCRLK